MILVLCFVCVFCVQVLPNLIMLMMLLRTQIRETELRWLLKSNLSLLDVRKVDVNKHEFES